MRILTRTPYGLEPRIFSKISKFLYYRDNLHQPSHKSRAMEPTEGKSLRHRLVRLFLCMIWAHYAKNQQPNIHETGINISYQDDKLYVYPHVKEIWYWLFPSLMNIQISYNCPIFMTNFKFPLEPPRDE